MVATFTTWFDAVEVLQAAVITFSIFISLTVFTFQTKINWSFLGMRYHVPMYNSSQGSRYSLY